MIFKNLDFVNLIEKSRFDKMMKIWGFAFQKVRCDNSWKIDFSVMLRLKNPLYINCKTLQRCFVTTCHYENEIHNF